MPGITQFNNVTFENITALTNFTGDPVQFIVRANSLIYGQLFYFIIMLILGAILYVLAQKARDQPLINIMYISTILSIVGFFFRVVEAVVNGVSIGLITDFQMWIFPLLTVIMAGIVWFSKQ